MKGNLAKARPPFGAAFTRAAAFFLLAAVLALPAFSQHGQWGERGDRGRRAPPRREDGRWRAEDQRERHERNAYSFVTYFYIDEIEREDGIIDIEFNAPVDPRGVSAQNFLVNGRPLPPSARFRLSRKGDKVEIVEAPEWRGRVVSIEVVGLHSVNGMAIETIPPIFLGEDEEYEREDDLEYVYWYWNETNGGRPFGR